MVCKEYRVYTWTVNPLVCASANFLFLFVFFSSQSLNAQDDYASFFSMSMDELMQVKVVSVHKEMEPFIETPAAVYVITWEDMAMSAAESIPDLLVRVPGVNVFQSRRHNASVGIRDDIQTFFSTNLVLLDGVSFYWPITGGALFETISVAIEDIERILFVDDEELIINAANEILTKYGYDVTIFGDAAQALQEFEKGKDRFDLVITDMTMPQMNGMEVAERILELQPDIPVILCSGHNELIDREKIAAMGVDYLQKPVAFGELVRVVRRILDKAKG